jgi:hypothetical protein
VKCSYAHPLSFSALFCFFLSIPPYLTFSPPPNFTDSPLSSPTASPPPNLTVSSPPNLIISPPLNPAASVLSSLTLSPPLINYHSLPLPYPTAQLLLHPFSLPFLHPSALPHSKPPPFCSVSSAAVHPPLILSLPLTSASVFSQLPLPLHQQPVTLTPASSLIYHSSLHTHSLIPILFPALSCHSQPHSQEAEGVTRGGLGPLARIPTSQGISVIPTPPLYRACG